MPYTFEKPWMIHELQCWFWPSSLNVNFSVGELGWEFKQLNSQSDVCLSRQWGLGVDTSTFAWNDLCNSFYNALFLISLTWFAYWEVSVFGLRLLWGECPCILYSYAWGDLLKSPHTWTTSVEANCSTFQSMCGWEEFRCLPALRVLWTKTAFIF